MPQPFDATTKNLVETHPEDWLEYLGLQRTAVECLEQLSERLLDVESWDELLAG
jgi:hypothetical protein